MDRRDFLKGTVGGAAGLLVASRIPSAFLRDAAAAAGPPFVHGIASGDPRARAAVIWTRVTPSPAAQPGSGRGKKVDVEWQVATDRRFRHVVREGRTTTGPNRDHTVKVDVRGLRPDREYRYRFRALGEISPRGQLRTAPAPGADPAHLRFGLASCSNWEAGYFTGYRHMADHDIRFVLHLGDYVYEYATGQFGDGAAIGRPHDPTHEMVSLADYRRRHAQYKTDPDLQRLHRWFPLLAVWDDHEVANDAYNGGAENHDPDQGEGDFAARRARAYQAYFEWMPIRRPRRRPRGTRIYRRLPFGQLADFHMLDDRQYRSAQPSSPADPVRHDPSRTLLGREQTDWLKAGLAAPGPRWRLVGNQVMITPFDAAPLAPFNVDAWDGYTANRAELLNHIGAAGVKDVVFLTGDIHTSWAADVPADENTYPAGGTRGVEFVGTSITSDNLNEILGVPPRSPPTLAAEAGIVANNPWVKYVEVDSHGYAVVDVTRERLQVDWYYLSERTDPNATASFARGFLTESGSGTVTSASGPAT